ncbi:hypothetical protein ACFL6U_08715 [Planctomycetota bacterium]
MESESLAIPLDFDDDIAMRVREENTGRFHASRLSAEFAAQLVANGTSADLDLAEKVLLAVLDCQETNQHDPHVGNFRWEREDEVVEDLNAMHIHNFRYGVLTISNQTTELDTNPETTYDWE